MYVLPESSGCIFFIVGKKGDKSKLLKEDERINKKTIKHLNVKQ